jgi:cytochrome P450
VLEESLRLYPPAWVLTRRALEPDLLAGTEVAAGTVLVISPWLLHRRPGAWPEPERFRPERFLAPAGRDCGYLPFGAGPRQCIGRDVALVEGTALLAGLLARVRLRPLPGAAAPRPLAGVSVRPRGGLRLLAAVR